MARCARAAAACRRDGMLRGKRPAWLCVRRRSLRRFAVGLLLLWCTVAVAVLDLLMTLWVCTHKGGTGQCIPPERHGVWI